MGGFRKPSNQGWWYIYNITPEFFLFVVQNMFKAFFNIHVSNHALYIFSCGKSIYHVINCNKEKNQYTNFQVRWMESVLLGLHC